MKCIWGNEPAEVDGDNDAKSAADWSEAATAVE